MTSPFSDELISAYLDGELTAEQQVRVENQLREDAQLRRMCDELRALRFTLQSIPSEDPPEDFAERVLRRAERRMLLGEEDMDGEEGCSKPPADVGTSPVSVATSSQRNWRLVTGVVATAAALILVAIVLYDPPGLSDLARAPEDTSANGTMATPEEVEREELERSKQPLASDDYGLAFGDGATDKLSPGYSAEYFETQDAPMAANGELPAARIQEGLGRDVAGEGESAGVVAGSDSTDTTEMSGSASASSAKDAQVLGEENARPTIRDLSSARGIAPQGGGAAETDGIGGMGGMGAGTASGIMPKKNPLADPAAGGESWKYGAQPSSRARRAMSPAVADALDKDPKWRTTLAENLATQLDRDQVLLVQVSVPANLRRDLETSSYRHSSIVRQESLPELGSVTRMLLERTNDVELKGRLPEPTPEKLELIEKDLELVSIEGTREEVRKNLVQLVSREDVQVRRVLSSADLRKSFTGPLKLPAAQRSGGVVPSTARDDDAHTAIDEMSEGEEEDAEGAMRERRFSFPGSRGGYPGRSDGKDAEGGAGRSNAYGSPDGSSGKRMEESRVKTEPGAEPGASAGALYGGRKELPAPTAPAAGPGEKPGKAEADAPVPDVAKQAKKQPRAPQSGQREHERPTQESLGLGQVRVQAKGELAYERSKKKDLPAMTSPAVTTETPQGEMVIHILFRFTPVSPAAKVQESSQDK